MAELTAQARRLLTGANFGHLATVMEDGSPHSSPIWVDAEDNHVVVNTRRGRVKERNMRRDPRVALSLVNHEDPYEEVHIRGRVVEMVEGDEAAEHIHSLQRKYRGTDRYPDPTNRGKVWIEPTAIHEGR